MAKNIWHSLPFEEVVREFGSDPEKGLTEQEVRTRQDKFGKNALPKEKPLSKVRIFLDQLKSPLIYILVIAGFITIFFQEWTDTIVIFGAVLLNTIVGFFQENKANQSLRALKEIVKIKAEVIREGNEMEIDSEDLVPGDIIILSSGGKVPADGRIIESHNLKINEAALTGEWIPAEKVERVLGNDVPMADRDNMVYMGGIIIDGRGKAVVTAIGSDTEMGRVATLVKETKEEKTPLQKKIGSFSRVIGIVIAVLAVLIFIGGILKGQDALEMFMTSIAIAVAAIPEGLPVAMTVILALGMQRILKRKGLVRKLVAAEILGSTSVIATDKTLTLTQGKMEVAKTVTLNSEISSQKKKTWGDVFKQNFKKSQILLIQAVALSNEAFVENPYEPYPIWRVRGRPTDKALLLAGAEVGIRKHEMEKIYKKTDEIPFNSDSKYIATLIGARPRAKIDKKTKISYIRDPLVKGADQVLFVTGAPEKIIGLSSCVQDDGRIKRIDTKTGLKLQEQLESLTGQGLRVVAAGYKKIKKGKKYKNLSDEINDLIFIGFIGLEDPIREEAKEAIRLCRKAGMRPVIVTGDHLLTAKAVGRELGLKTGKNNTINGSELDNMSDEEFQKKVKDIEIYSRVEPRHKMRIIEAWQKAGKVVAMTGDGINDAPALKKADIGVALGSGTDVAKEVSDLVLLTDNFNIIVAAIEEGRAIIDNIRKVITYLLSDSFTETILIGASLMLGWPLPISAVQILWINLIEDGLPGVALAFEPKEEGILERKPEDKDTHLLTKEMRAIIFVIGILTDILLLGLLWWLLKGSHEMEYVRTMVFVGLGIDSLFYVFSCKNLRRSIWHINPFSNRFLVISWLMGALALTASVYLPIFNALLETVPLQLTDWMILAGLGMANLLLIEAAKYYFIVRHQTE